VKITFSIKRVVIGVLVVIAIVAIVSAVYSYYKDETPITETVYTQLPQKTLVTIREVEIEVEKVVVLEKEKIVEKLVLPTYISEAEDKQVIGVVEVPKHQGKTSIVAVMDTDTGKTEFHAKKLRRPFFEFTNDKELGARYGYNSSLAQEAIVYGRWTFVRMANFHLSLYAETTSEPNAKGMLEVSYRF
jgi:hypothetical protein